MKLLSAFCFFLVISTSVSVAQLNQKITALKGLKILPHQYFDLSGATFANIYHALNEATLNKKDSLKEDSKRIAKEVYTALSATRMEFLVYYFDRAAYNFGKGMMYKMIIQDGKIIDFKPIPVSLDKSVPVDNALMIRLHQYPLEPNQYIIPYYGVTETDPPGLCLSTIVDDPKANDLQAKSKKLYDEFIKTVKPSIQYPVIAIRFHTRFDEQNESVFTYPAY